MSETKKPDQAEVTTLEPTSGGLHSLAASTVMRQHFGPLPPPEQLVSYEHALPGLAERIVKMAENQAAHRQGFETKVIGAEIDRAALGMKFGFTIGIAGLLASILMGWMGHPASGAAIGAVDLVALVSVFVVGHHAATKETSDEP